MKDKKLIALLGSAVVFGLGGTASAQPKQGESTCGAMGGNMKKMETQKGEKKEEGKKKKDEKKKQKEMTCGGQMTCGGNMKNQGG